MSVTMYIKAKKSCLLYLSLYDKIGKIDHNKNSSTSMELMIVQ